MQRNSFSQASTESEERSGMGKDKDCWELPGIVGDIVLRDSSLQRHGVDGTTNPRKTGC